MLIAWARRNSKAMLVNLSMTAAIIAVPLAAVSQDADDLARQLANPVASLVSVPFQLNYDDNYGASGEGSITRLNIQPVIPFDLNDDWNLISRTVFSIVDTDDVPAPGLGDSGLGDTVQSFFFSPKEPTDSGWIWGAGPALLFPTATEDSLGADQWGVGPTAVALKQQVTLTFGALANHLESSSGSRGRADVSATFFQPFVSYITPRQTTWGANIESTYDWESESWSVPLNLTVAQLVKVGDQLMQVGGGIRYWLDSPPGQAEDWGFRLSVTLLFPK